MIIDKLVINVCVLMDKGRSLSVQIIMLSAVWICYMGVLTAFSPNYYWILILRGMVGLGFGGAIQS